MRSNDVQIDDKRELSRTCGATVRCYGNEPSCLWARETVLQAKRGDNSSSLFKKINKTLDGKQMKQLFALSQALSVSVK